MTMQRTRLTRHPRVKHFSIFIICAHNARAPLGKHGTKSLTSTNHVSNIKHDTESQPRAVNKTSNKLAPYGTDGRLLLTANFKVT